MRFAVRRGDVKEGRFDTAFRLSERTEKRQSRYKTIPLNELVSFYSGGTPSKGRNDFWDGDIPWVSPKDFGPHTIYDSEDHISLAGRIDASLHLIPENSLLMVVRSGVLKHSLPVAVTGKPVTINQDLKAMIPLGEVLARYLADYFVVFGRQILPAISKHSTTVQSLNTPQLESLPIPLPPLETQRVLVNELEAARQSRRDKLAQADALLSSLDGWLLDQLGLQPPREEKRACFAVRLGDLGNGKRMNADYFHPERVTAIREQEQRKDVRAEALQDIADFCREVVSVEDTAIYLGLANVASNTGELVNYDEEIAGNAFKFQKDDVLFARLRPYLNKVYRAESSGVCSPEFHVIRIRPATKPEDEILPDYLSTILRSSLILAQTRHMMTGNTHPRLANEDVTSLIVPIPRWEVQQTIADEVRSRREQARRLRDEAQAEWSAAKAHFEAQLLG